MSKAAIVRVPDVQVARSFSNRMHVQGSTSALKNEEKKSLKTAQAV